MNGDPGATPALVRASFEASPDAMVVIDAHGHQVAMNARFIALWDFPPPMLQRRDLHEMREHVAAQLRDPTAFRRANAQVDTRDHEGVLDELERLDGRVFERHVTPLARYGHPGVLLVRWRDISDRRQAERAFDENRTRLQAVYAHAREAILLADDQGRFLDCNPAAEQLTGRSRPQLLQLGVADVRAAQEAPFPERWQQFLAQGEASGEVVLQRPDGSLRIARFNAVAHIQPGVHLSILADDTEAQLARQRELETRTQMSLAMVNAGLVFWSADLASGVVTLADPHWISRLLGYAADTLGHGLDDLDPLVHPQDRERRQGEWAAHVEGHTPTFECEFRLRHQRGHWVWVLARGQAIARDARGRATQLVGVRIDITRQKLAEQELEARAFTDGLTGLLNRRRFIELAEVEVTRALRHEQPVALLMVDLDHFKSVNDRYGHAGGDTALEAFADVARSVMRGSDLLGRVGGEEFAALLPQTDMPGALALAERLRRQVQAQQLPLASGTLRFSVSIGVAGHSGRPGAPGGSIEALMLAADTALYRAKDGGRDRVLPASHL